MTDTNALLAEIGLPPDPPEDPTVLPAPHEKWPSGANRGIAKVGYSHAAMIDAIIANPTISQNDLAMIFGYTAGWVSQVISSDAFQAALLERAANVVDPTLRATVQERFKALVTRSMAILMEKLDRPASSIPDNLAIRSLELGSRALGYGAKEVPQAPQVSMHVHLENLGEGLTTLLRKKKAEAGTTYDQLEHDDGQD